MSQQILTLVPELSYYVKNITTSTTINQQLTKIPVPLDSSTWQCEPSILTLLFSYTFNDPDYYIYYKKVNLSAVEDKNVTQRVVIYAGYLNSYACDTTSVVDTSSEIFIDSTTGVSTQIIPDVIAFTDPVHPGIFNYGDATSYNIFSITVGEKQMLDLLLDFKAGRPVDISNISYNMLASSLSKLIYIYLDLELNNNYERYNTDTPINTANRLLAWAYEKWFLDHYYRRLKFSPVIPYDQNFRETGNASQIITLTESNITSKSITFPTDKIPISGDYIFIVYDSLEQIQGTDYTFYYNQDSENPIARIEWNNLGLENKVQAGRKMYILWGYYLLLT